MLGESTFFDQGLANSDQIGVVEGQDNDSCPADAGSADQDRSYPSKMAFPLMAPGVKQRGQTPSLRIDASDVWTLVAIAVKTRQRQVCESGSAAVLARDDVVYLKGHCRVKLLLQATVLTGFLSPSPDGANQLRFQAHDARRRLSDFRALECSSARRWLERT
jgi:hypothetical protein